MTIYGESDVRFRPRPASLRLAVFSLAAVVLATLLASLLLSQIEAAIRLLVGESNGWTLFAGIAHFLSTSVESAAAGIARTADAAVLSAVSSSLIAVVISLLVFRLWPTRQSLATRLFVSSFSMATVSLACGIALRASGLIPPLRGDSGLTGAVMSLAAVLIAGTIIFIMERATNESLTNLYSLATPAERIRIWILRIAIPFILLALAAHLHGRTDLAAGHALVVFSTLLVNLSTIPKERFELLRHPEMREAAATLPVVALLLSGVSVYLFGFPAAGREPRLLLLTSRGEARLSSADRLQTDLSSLRPEPPKKKVQEKPPEKKIDIRWSKPREKRPGS